MIFQDPMSSLNPIVRIGRQLTEAMLLKGKARVDSPKHAALTAARYLFACVAGCIVLDYLLGFIVQSAITGVAMPVVAIASMGFIVGDCIKAVVASLVASGLAKLQ